MGSSKFSSHGSLQEMIDSFNKMQKPPTKTIFALEMSLQKGFQNTQQHVHIITSSLKWSGTTTSNFDGETWEGTVTYGGPSKGINNPVEYAIYERQRGGEHDFMSPLEATESEMEKIVKSMKVDGDFS